MTDILNGLSISDVAATVTRQALLTRGVSTPIIAWKSLARYHYAGWQKTFRRELDNQLDGQEDALKPADIVRFIGRNVTSDDEIQGIPEGMTWRAFLIEQAVSLTDRGLSSVTENIDHLSSAILEELAPIIESRSGVSINASKALAAYSPFTAQIALLDDLRKVVLDNRGKLEDLTGLIIHETDKMSLLKYRNPFTGAETYAVAYYPLRLAVMVTFNKGA